MKKLYFQCTLICLLFMNSSYGMDSTSPRLRRNSNHAIAPEEQRRMDQAPQQPELSTKYVQVQADVRLAPTAIITKQTNIQVPSILVATIQNKKQSEQEILTGYIKQRTPELTQVLAVFVSLMQHNSTGQSLPALGQFCKYDATLFSLLKTPKTSFFCLCDNRLILDWPLGIHDGWRLSHNVTVQYVPNHPRKGTRSEAMVEFENRAKNKHFVVPFKGLVTLYEKAGKKTIINRETVVQLTKTTTENEFSELHAADMVAMALHYIANHAK